MTPSLSPIPDRLPELCRDWQCLHEKLHRLNTLPRSPSTTDRIGRIHHSLASVLQETTQLLADVDATDDQLRRRATALSYPSSPIAPAFVPRHSAQRTYDSTDDESDHPQHVDDQLDDFYSNHDDVLQHLHHPDQHRFTVSLGSLKTLAQTQSSRARSIIRAMSRGKLPSASSPAVDTPPPAPSPPKRSPTPFLREEHDIPHADLLPSIVYDDLVDHSPVATLTADHFEKSFATSPALPPPRLSSSSTSDELHPERLPLSPTTPSSSSRLKSKRPWRVSKIKTLASKLTAKSKPAKSPEAGHARWNGNGDGSVSSSSSPRKQSSSTSAKLKLKMHQRKQMLHETQQAAHDMRNDAADMADATAALRKRMERSNRFF